MQKNVKTCSIINVIESTITEIPTGLPIHADRNWSSLTKAFLGQLTVLYILCLKLAFVRKDINNDVYVKNISNLNKLPEAIKTCIRNESVIQLWQKIY